MFERNLFEYFETGNLLAQLFGISMTEYNAMMPWHLFVYLTLIRNEQEKKRDRALQGR